MKTKNTKEDGGGRARRASSVAAFTLVEVLIAVAVIGVMFTSLYAGITSGFAVVNQARENLRATQIMQDRLEELRIYTWDDLIKFGTTSNTLLCTNFWVPFYPTTSVTNSDIQTTLPSGSTNGFYYYGTLSVTNSGLTEGYSNDMRMFTVTLNWTNGNRRTRSLSTFVSKYGMQNYLY